MKLHLLFTYFIELLAILSGVYCWKRLTLPYRVVLIQTFLSFSNDLIAWGIMTYFDANTTWMFNFYLVVELWLMGYVCMCVIANKLIKKTIVTAMVVITIADLVSNYINGVSRLNNWMIVVVALFFIISFVVVIFANSLFTNKDAYKQPLFLIAISMILYYSTVIPLFGLYSYFVEFDMRAVEQLYNINTVALILRYALVAIAFYLYALQAKREYV